MVIIYNKWILAVFGFPYPITLTMWHMGFSSVLAFCLVILPPIPDTHLKLHNVVMCKPSRTAQGVTPDLHTDQKAPQDIACQRHGSSCVASAQLTQGYDGSCEEAKGGRLKLDGSCSATITQIRMRWQPLTWDSMTAHLCEA